MQGEEFFLRRQELTSIILIVILWANSLKIFFSVCGKKSETKVDHITLTLINTSYNIIHFNSFDWRNIRITNLNCIIFGCLSHECVHDDGYLPPLLMLLFLLLLLLCAFSVSMTIIWTKSEPLTTTMKPKKQRAIT